MRPIFFAIPTMGPPGDHAHTAPKSASFQKMMHIDVDVAGRDRGSGIEIAGGAGALETG